MTTLLFDIETNGFLSDLDRVHCLVIQDVDTGEVGSFADQPGYSPIKEGLARLRDADVIAGHNVIDFDLPALRKVYPTWGTGAQVRDTLVMARVLWPRDRLMNIDAPRVKAGKMPGQLMGNHSLEAFGYRLGDYKGDYGKTPDTKGTDIWATWNKPMQDYCEQDVAVTAKLWHRIQREGWSPECLDLEHEVALILARQERRGFTFDMQAAAKLHATLVQRKADIEAELVKTFPPIWAPEAVPPKARYKPEWLGSWAPARDNKKMGYTAGAPLTKVYLQDFNAASRDHIAARLKRLGWEPTEFTDGGKSKVDETVLGQLPYPQAKPLAAFLMLEKRLGQLAEGKEAWLRHVGPDGRIHGRVNGNGAVTGRMTHASPNMAQVPASGAEYGRDCRALFMAGTALDGAQLVLVGCDADALELRCLAHFMARYDDGAYVRTVLEGRKEDGTDIHSVNCRALGLDPKTRYQVGGANPTGRDIAKVWFSMGTLAEQSACKQRCEFRGHPTRAILSQVP